MVLNTESADRIAAVGSRLGLYDLGVSERLERVRQELVEVMEEIAKGDLDKAESEMGDLLLSTAMLFGAFPWKGSADAAYAASASKITSRLAHIEACVNAGGDRDLAVKAAKVLYP